MTDISKDDLVSMLGALGYAVPEPDLTDVWHRLNALIEAMRSFDSEEFYRSEPWPSQPLRDVHE